MLNELPKSGFLNSSRQNKTIHLRISDGDGVIAIHRKWKREALAVIDLFQSLMLLTAPFGKNFPQKTIWKVQTDIDIFGPRGEIGRSWGQPWIRPANARQHRYRAQHIRFTAVVLAHKKIELLQRTNEN